MISLKSQPIPVILLSAAAEIATGYGMCLKKFKDTNTATGFPQQIWVPQSKTANHRLMLGLGYLF